MQHMFRRTNWYKIVCFWAANLGLGVTTFGSLIMVADQRAISLVVEGFALMVFGLSFTIAFLIRENGETLEEIKDRLAKQ